MAKSLTFKDILTKLSHIFPHDVRIINYKYCISGDLSEKDTVGVLYVVLDDSYSSIIKEKYKDFDDILVVDIKKAKVDEGEYVKTFFLPEIKKVHQKLIKSLDEKTKKVKSWSNLPIGEEEIDTLFNKKGVISLFNESDGVPSINISSTLFPMITAKNIQQVNYSVKYNDDDRLAQLILLTTIPELQLYNIINYINPLDEDY